MSSERSSSGVRNLRSLFENKAGENSTNTRGRSPGDLGSDADLQRPRSKVRSSFFPVAPAMATTVEEAAGESQKAADEVVGSGTNQDNSAAATSTANPDKPVTSADEDEVSIKPGDPSSESAVSGGKALASTGQDLRKPGAGTKTNGTSKSTVPAKKPLGAKPATNTKPLTGSSKDVPSKAAKPAAPTKAAPAPTDSTKRLPRASLAAPTASSSARTVAGKTAAPAEKSETKPKPREVTKPLNVSSHLTAPTAAFRAKHESQPAAAAGIAPKPKTAPVKSTPRSSPAGRPDSQTSATSSRKAPGPPDGSFLNRMTRPTAASTGRVQEKTDTKTPPKPKSAPVKAKPSNQPKAAAPASTAAKAVADATEPDATVVEESLAQDEAEKTTVKVGDAEMVAEDAVVEPVVVPVIEEKAEPASEPAKVESASEIVEETKPAEKHLIEASAVEAKEEEKEAIAEEPVKLEQVEEPSVEANEEETKTQEAPNETVAEEAAAEAITHEETKTAASETAAVSTEEPKAVMLSVDVDADKNTAIAKAADAEEEEEETL